MGHDDRNIYGFAGASIASIRRIKADHAAQPVWLTENYRSNCHFIVAANQEIAPAAARMKLGDDMTVNRARGNAAPGEWAALNPVAQGRVSLIDSGPGDRAQAVAALDPMIRLSQLDPDWSWWRCAIIAGNWRRLEPLRAYAEAKGIAVNLGNESLPSLWRLREMQAFIRALLADRSRLLTISDLVAMPDCSDPSPAPDASARPAIHSAPHGPTRCVHASTSPPPLWSARPQGGGPVPCGGRLPKSTPHADCNRRRPSGDPVTLLRDGESW